MHGTNMKIMVIKIKAMKTMKNKIEICKISTTMLKRKIKTIDIFYYAIYNYTIFI